MKEVLISIRPEWCELIASGKKTVEVRKTKPKLNTPFKCYIYCTKPSKKYQTVAKPMVLNDDELFKLPNGKIKYGNSIELVAYDDRSEDNFLNSKVIGEFVCNKITRIAYCGYDNERIELNIVDENLTIKKLDKGFFFRCRLSFNDIEKYANGNEVYGWHISDLKLYEEPKDIGEFYRGGMLSYDDWLYGIYNGNGGARSSYESYKNAFKLSKAPQSWCYVEGAEE